jgi:hypothetical protein
MLWLPRAMFHVEHCQSYAISTITRLAVALHVEHEKGSANTVTSPSDDPPGSFWVREVTSNRDLPCQIPRPIPATKCSTWNTHDDWMTRCAARGPVPRGTLARRATTSGSGSSWRSPVTIPRDRPPNQDPLAKPAPPSVPRGTSLQGKATRTAEDYWAGPGVPRGTPTTTG